MKKARYVGAQGEYSLFMFIFVKFHIQFIINAWNVNDLFVLSVKSVRLIARITWHSCGCGVTRVNNQRLDVMLIVELK